MLFQKGEEKKAARSHSSEGWNKGGRSKKRMLWLGKRTTWDVRRCEKQRAVGCRCEGRAVQEKIQIAVLLKNTQILESCIAKKEEKRPGVSPFDAQ